ncbi:MAG: 2Fe-2S iron-sulfur cluster-binding protein [Anaerolineae bacterium]|nr:(2Fe-2S)-binding protein [Thermoflexales bacterium]MDW8406906.1 2Fe-2S iron-sulfur cluster-binding protein [Anaerolineae bacterium]
MPKLTVLDKTTEVAAGRRLVLAIEDAGVRIGHRCGGIARCTTCRVQFVAGEPDTMTEAEYQLLNERGLFGQYRLACQIVCDHDMSVTPALTADNQPQWSGDTGPTPDAMVQPKAVWQPISALKASHPPA